MAQFNHWMLSNWWGGWLCGAGCMWGAVLYLGKKRQ